MLPHDRRLLDRVAGADPRPVADAPLPHGWVRPCGRATAVRLAPTQRSARKTGLFRMLCDRVCSITDYSKDKRYRDRRDHAECVVPPVLYGWDEAGISPTRPHNFLETPEPQWFPSCDHYSKGGHTGRTHWASPTPHMREQQEQVLHESGRPNWGVPARRCGTRIAEIIQPLRRRGDRPRGAPWVRANSCVVQGKTPAKVPRRSSRLEFGRRFPQPIVGS